MPDDRFLEESLPQLPTVTPTVTDEYYSCCLCGEKILSGRMVAQRFEADKDGTIYSAHAKCSHEYAMAIRAFRSLTGI